MVTITFYLDNKDNLEEFNGFNVGHVYIKLSDGTLPIVTEGQVPSGFYGFHPDGIHDDGERYNEVISNNDYNFIARNVEVSNEQYNQIIDYINGQINNPDAYTLLPLQSGGSRTCADFTNTIYQIINPAGDIGDVFTPLDTTFFQNRVQRVI